MNRNDFMKQLESLLQNIAPSEREEALQYYNDYFDDAGRENEQNVIEALGNPARVAESIRRDLLGGYGEGTARKVLASDRALMKYGEGGQSESREPEKDGGDGNDASAGRSQDTTDAFAGYNQNTNNVFSGYDQDGQNTMEGNPPYTRSQGMPDWEDDIGEKPKKGSMPVWAVALLVTVLVLLSPGILGLIATGIGVVLSAFIVWFSLMFAFGAVSLCMLVVLVVLVIVGVMCIPANPWVGMSVIGSGLICGAIGVLFLMLTVTVGGALPAICRGLASLFKKKKPVRG